MQFVQNVPLLNDELKGQNVPEQVMQSDRLKLQYVKYDERYSILT